MRATWKMTQVVAEPQFAIEVRGLIREYPSRSLFDSVTKVARALDDVEFSVKTWELFGLIGPNGTGKTTTGKIPTTLLTQTSGEAYFLGLDVRKEEDDQER